MAKKAADAEKPTKKSGCRLSAAFINIATQTSTAIHIAKSSASVAKKGKVSPYNKFMKTELARLKESDPDMKHAER